MRRLDLAGPRGVVVGIASARSIAYGGARAPHAAGAGPAITYLNATAALLAARRGERAAP
jgi:enoyl-[acyl-carrier-protein] reductase (NADH)